MNEDIYFTYLHRIELKYINLFMKNKNSHFIRSVHMGPKNEQKIRIIAPTWWTKIVWSGSKVGFGTFIKRKFQQKVDTIQTTSAPCVPARWRSARVGFIILRIDIVTIIGHPKFVQNILPSYRFDGHAESQQSHKTTDGNEHIVSQQFHQPTEFVVVHKGRWSDWWHQPERQCQTVARTIPPERPLFQFDDEQGANQGGQLWRHCQSIGSVHQTGQFPVCLSTIEALRVARGEWWLCAKSQTYIGKYIDAKWYGVGGGNQYGYTNTAAPGNIIDSSIIAYCTATISTIQQSTQRRHVIRSQISGFAGDNGRRQRTDQLFTFEFDTWIVCRWELVHHQQLATHQQHRLGVDVPAIE